MPVVACSCLQRNISSKYGFGRPSWLLAIELNNGNKAYNFHEMATSDWLAYKNTLHIQGFKFGAQIETKNSTRFYYSF